MPATNTAKTETTTTYTPCQDAWHVGTPGRTVGEPCPGCSARDAGLEYQISDKISEELDFGADDRFGRRIGAKVVTWRGTVGDRAYFFGHTQATRNGQDYGASQWSKQFTSSTERDRWLDKYLTSARKRATTASGK